MIVIVETANKENVAPQPRAKRAPTTRKTASKTSSITVPSAVKTSVEVAAIQGEDDNTIPEKEKQRQLNGNNVRMADLPGFATKKWRDTFLPTLYDEFFTSSNPFDDFCIGTPTFVNILQEIINKVYPEVEYTVTSSDSIHFLVKLILNFRTVTDELFFQGL
jgi:hypothetical protein